MTTEQILIIATFLDYHISDDKTQYKDSNGFWCDIEDLCQDIYKWSFIIEAVDQIATICAEPEELDNFTYITVYGGQIRIATHFEGVFGEVVELIKMAENGELTKIEPSGLTNGDLVFDLDKLKTFDAPITVARAFDGNLDYPYAIDVEDGSYWYAEAEDRDADFERLKVLIPHFTYIED